MDIWVTLFMVATFFGLLVFSILFFSPERRHSDLLLSVYILCLVLFASHNLLVETGLMIRFPWLFRLPRPLMYLVAPLVYLYVRSVAYEEVGFRKRDWLFCLPTVIHALELMPFYFLEREEKLWHLRWFMEDMNRGLTHVEGLLPAAIHPWLIEIWTVALMIPSFRLLLSLRRQKKRFRDFQNRLQIRWLTLFVWMNFFVFALLVVHGFTRAASVNVFRLNTIEVAIMLLLISIALFFHPHILYGFKGTQPMIIEADEEIEVDKGRAELAGGGYIIPAERRRDILFQIRTMFEEQKVYRQHGYTIKNLGADTGVSYNYLSQVINQEFGMNFNELINSYRVAYFKELVLDSQFREYTLEALAEQAGFNSRATFSRSFSRLVGCTPSEYVRTVSKGS